MAHVLKGCTNNQPIIPPKPPVTKLTDCKSSAGSEISIGPYDRNNLGAPSEEFASLPRRKFVSSRQTPVLRQGTESRSPSERTSQLQPAAIVFATLTAKSVQGGKRFVTRFDSHPFPAVIRPFFLFLCLIARFPSHWS